MKWTPDNIQFLKDTEGMYELEDLVVILGRSPGSIRRKLFLHDIKQGKYKKESKNCLDCGKQFECYISDNRKFCSSECSCRYNNKNRDPEIYKKLSAILKGREFPKKILINKCVICDKEFEVGCRRKHVMTCGKECRSKLVAKNASVIHKELAKDIDRRNFLKEIGRKGGFGTKGYTDKGVYYQSLFEKKVFEYLDKIGEEYIPHRPLPNSSKISDVYLPERDMWVELDGIDREKRKEWLGKDYDYWLDKLEQYKLYNLSFKIFKTFEEFRLFLEIKQNDMINIKNRRRRIYKN